MSYWNQKHLNKIANISKACANDPCLPMSARDLFSDALDYAIVLHLTPLSGGADDLDAAFAKLCAGCKDAALYRCQENADTIHYCQLMRND